MRRGACILIAGLAGLAGLAGCPQSPDPPGQEAGSDSDLDPLSMPSEPTLDPGDFQSALLCGSCHPVHAWEWRLSRHAYAMTDPVFRALTRIRQDDLDGVEDQFCTQCHSSICTRGGECVPGYDFESLSPISLEGITCEACHRVSEVVRPYNSGHVLDPTGPIIGPIADPQPTSTHESVGGDLLGTSEFCAGCHDVIETNGLHLERPYGEWLESPAAVEGKPCQSCHMPTYDGQAADGGPMRQGLHRHRFVGVELPRIPEIDNNPELRAELQGEIEALLQTAVTVALEVPEQVQPGGQLDVVVRVDNEIGAHAFPTGSTNLRQAWVAVTATDASGAVLYQTGHLDENGDLGNFFSRTEPFFDDDLLLLSSTLIDAAGQPTLFPWRATEHRSGAISPDHDRVFTLFVPITDDAVGPIEIDATVHFRTYPPFLVDLLGLTDQLGELEVYDIATTAATVSLAPIRQ